MATPARQDFLIKTNGDWERIWQVKNNGDPVDITSYDFQLQVRAEKNPNSPEYLTLTVGSGITIIDASQGQFKVSISPDVNLKVRKVYYYDLVVEISGKHYVWVEGQMTFDPGVTYWDS